MFVDESLWIKRALRALPLKSGMRVLDIGSSTLDFRTVVQPHIEGNVFGPLRERGLLVSHLDARAEPGVDIVADVETLEGVAEIYELVLCTSLLEHVVDRARTLHHVKRVVGPRGHLLLTVPRRYPFHADPIDTGFRPNARELRSLLEWREIVSAEVVTVKEPAHYQNRTSYRRWFLPWQVSCVLARKP